MTVYHIDAFTDTIFHGNPAAVIPLREWISDELMQAIAAENNLSETAYFIKTADGYHIRWFTPGGEIELCGHATLASAFVIKKYIDEDAKVIQFSTDKAGPLRVICSEELFGLDFPSRLPTPCEPPTDLLRSLGVNSAVEILKSRDYFVVLENEQAVLDLKPDFRLMRKLNTVGVIVSAKGDSAEVVSRSFFPAMNIDEDPVTGSAHCNLIPYWSNKLGKTKFFAKQISKRGGDLWCELKGDRVLMSGKAVEFMKGTISSQLLQSSDLSKKVGTLSGVI